jgi:malonyl-CoA O-methyltransferase
MNYLYRLRTLFRRPLRTLSSVEAYALWAKSYPAQAHNPLMIIEQEAMLQLMPNLKDKIVLDLACGTGRYGTIALERGAKQVIGLDNSRAMLQRGHIENTTLASTEKIPLASDSIDVILCGLALGHLSQLKPTLQEISRILKPNGSAVISDFHPFQYLSGARRTFQSSKGRAYQVEHYVHLYSNYHAVGQATGLRITGISEPCLNDDKPIVLVLRYDNNAN